MTRVSGLIATRFHSIEVEDTATAMLEFENGALGTLDVTTAAAPGRPRRLQVVGSAGSLVLEGDHLQGTGAASAENASSPVVTDVSAHVRIIEDFVDAVRNRRAPVCDGHEGRRSVEVVEAVYRSAREKRPIDLSKA